MLHKIKKHINMLCIGTILAVSPTIQAAPEINATGAERVSRSDANAWLEIDTEAFGRNLQAVKKMLNNQQQICAVFKADAYGNSIALLMPEIIRHDISCVGITSNEEARAVRASGYSGRIARLRTATTGEIQNALPYHVEELAGNLEIAQFISHVGVKNNQTMKIHISLNSGGMNRNGLALDTEKGKQDAVAITQLPNIDVVGIMTHFAVEEEADVRHGLAAFQKESSWLINAAKLDRKKITLHAANSFTTVAVPEARLDMVRLGSLLYGEPYAGTKLETIMSFKSRVASVNHYPKGSTVGYDRTFKLERDSRLANLPFGYSDGYRRAFTNKGRVLIRGHLVPVVGKVSMNTTMVDVTDFPDIEAGDEVVMFGKQGTAEIKQSDIEDVAGVVFADLYTIWGSSNPRFKKEFFKPN